MRKRKIRSIYKCQIRPERDVCIPTRETTFLNLPMSNPKDDDDRCLKLLPLFFRPPFAFGVAIFATRCLARLSGESARVVNVFPIFFVPFETAFPIDLNPAFCSKQHSINIEQNMMEHAYISDKNKKFEDDYEDIINA